MPNKTQSGPDRSLAELHRATDTLSTMLSQEVRDLHARQKAARRGVVLLPPVEEEGAG